MEVDDIVWIALDQFDVVVDVFTDVRKSLFKDLWHEPQRRALIEAIAVMVDEGAPATDEIVLFDHCNGVALLRETGCQGDTTDTCADDDDFL